MRARRAVGAWGGLVLGLALGAPGCGPGGTRQRQAASPAALPAVPPPASPAPAVPDPNQRYVSLRIFPTQRPDEQEEALRAIARAVELPSVLVDEEKSVAAFIEAQCGNLPTPLLRVEVRLFREHNPTLAQADKLAKGSTVTLPPCPRLDPGGPIRITTGADVWSHLTGEMGAAGCDSKKEVARRSGFKVACQSSGCCDETDAALAKVKAGQTLVIPFRSSLRQWRLKDPGNFDDGSFRAQLERLPNCGVVDVTFSPRPSLVKIIKVMSTADLGPAAQECADAANSERWPFHPEPVQARLDENGTFRDQVDKARATNIIVADTGLTLTPAIRPFVSFTQSEATPNFRDDDNNGFVDDAYGFTVEWLHGPPDAFSNLPDSEHGIVVAGAIVGTSIPKLEALVRDRLRLRAVNIVNASGLIPGNNLLTALRYGNVEAIGAKVVNFSVSGPIQDPRETSENLRLKTYPLMVAAAGNDGKDIDTNDADFPGAFRSDDFERLVVVAAHGPSGSLLGFSNYGSKTVDLAAPGCAVPTTDSSGKPTRKEGTSMAAPLVSMAAGLLFSEGLSTEETRDRLLASVDFAPGLKDKLFSGGTLNVARALDIYNDEVTRRNGKVLRGRLADTTFVYGTLGVPSEKMLKLVVGDDRRVFVLRKHLNGVKRDQDEPITGPTHVAIQTIPGAPGSTVRVDLGDVKEIVFRGRPWPQCAEQKLKKGTQPWYDCKPARLHKAIWEGR
jgi:hypothetical protein